MFSDPKPKSLFRLRWERIVKKRSELLTWSLLVNFFSKHGIAPILSFSGIWNSPFLFPGCWEPFFSLRIFPLCFLLFSPCFFSLRSPLQTEKRKERWKGKKEKKKPPLRFFAVSSFVSRAGQAGKDSPDIGIFAKILNFSKKTTLFIFMRERRYFLTL